MKSLGQFEVWLAVRSQVFYGDEVIATVDARVRELAVGLHASAATPVSAPLHRDLMRAAKGSAQHAGVDAHSCQLHAAYRRSMLGGRVHGQQRAACRG